MLASAAISRVAPAVIERPQRAARLPERLAPLRLGLGVDEVGEALGFGEVELAVLEGAAGELSRLGGPQAVERPPRRGKSPRSPPVRHECAARPCPRR